MQVFIYFQPAAKMKKPITLHQPSFPGPYFPDTYPCSQHNHVNIGSLVKKQTLSFAKFGPEEIPSKTQRQAFKNLSKEKCLSTCVGTYLITKISSQNGHL